MAKRRAMSDEDAALAAQMIELGDSLDDVAKHFGVSRTTLWRRVGLTGKRAAAKIEQNVQYFVYQSAASGLSVAEIAAKYSIGESTVYRILKKYEEPQEHENVDPVERAANPGPRRHTRFYRPRR